MTIVKADSGLKVFDCSNPHFRIFRKHGKYPSNLTLGFENEIVYSPLEERFADTLNERVAKYMERNPHLYMKEETSNEGVEINSYPFNWNWLQANIQAAGNKNFIDELAGLKTPYYFKVDKQCGFHIHLSRNFFSKKHLDKMVKFFYSPKHGEFLFSISKRPKWSFDAYCSNKLPERTVYCGHDTWKDVPYTLKEIASFSSYKFDSKMGEKSSILNLCPKKTIEIRMFRGTTNPVLFRAYLEFALAVSLFTKDAAYNKVTIENFKQFVKRNIKLYKNANRLITRPKSLGVH